MAMPHCNSSTSRHGARSPGIKLTLIALAGMNLVWFVAVERRRVLALPDGAETGLGTKTSAALSLLLWFAIIIVGRLLPSFEGDAGLFAPPIL